MYPPPKLSLYLLNFVLFALCWGNIYLKEWFYPPPLLHKDHHTGCLLNFVLLALCWGNVLERVIPPIPPSTIKTTTQVVCSILSCLLWTVEQYLPCALTHDSYTETPPQKLNVNVLHSVLRCTYHAHGHPADAGIQEACAGVGGHFALEVVGSLPWYAMVLYLFPAQKKKKTKMHFNYIHHMS